MRLFALLSLVGFVAAVAASSSANQLKWRPGTEYQFDYDGRLLTGIPELATQYSGLGLRCKVVVKVSTQNKIGLTITEAKYARVNEELHSDGSETDKNWRQIKLPPFVEVPSEHKRFLAMPIVFEFGRTGTFEKLTVSQDEPEWSVNFKKALVSIFHVKYEQDSLAGIEDNRIVSDDSSSSSDDESSYVDYWKTKEMSLDGTCDVTYQINELPAYMIRENREKEPFAQGCPEGSKYYGIVKTRDVASCSKRTAFVYYKPGFFRCTTGNCEGMWSRSSITRYITCGKSRNDLRIQSVINEGELHQNLLGFKTEKFLTGSLQELKLRSEKTLSTNENIEYPQNAIVVNDLYYEYQIKPRTSADGLPLVSEDSLEEGNLIENNPRNKRPIRIRNSSGQKGFAPEKIVPEIMEMYRQIINEDLFDFEKIADKQINMKAMGIARGFTVLNKTTISHIYETLKSEFSNDEEKKTVFKNVFFDTLMMGGSSSNILFVKEKILSGELSKTQIVSFFTFLPQYVFTPTRGLLKSLYQLITSPAIKEKPMLYSHALMSYTTLIQKACIADNREVSYPTNVYGDFCNPESDIVVNTWIPYLQRELNEATTPERRNLVIVTLGLMGHKNVIPTLVPFIENYGDNNSQRNGNNGENKYSPMNRFLAIYALSNVGMKHPELVEPLVFSVFSNPAERTEIRIGAFNVILRSEPSMTVFHKIAAATWREKNLEVLEVVNTAFYSLSRQQSLDSMEVTGSSLPRKAWLVYPLIKKTGSEFPTSASVYTSEYLKVLGVGYRKVTGWIDDAESALPSHIYSRLTYFMDRYQFTPIEFGVKTRGIENLLKQIIDIISPDSSRDSREERDYDENDSSSSEDDYNTDKIHDEWRDAINKLNLRGNNKRNGDDTEGAFFLNVFEDSPMFFSFQSSSAEALKSKITHLLGDVSVLKSLARGEEKHLNFQRIFDLTPSELSIPSDMGFPILVEVHMPVTLSVRGKMRADLFKKRESPSVSMEFKTLFASQMTGWVGTICPFTDEFSFTGIEKHTVVNMPVDFALELNVPEHKMKLRMKPYSEKPVDVVTFEVRPFTVRQKIYSLKPMTLSPEFKVIESRSPIKSLSYNNVGDFLGLNLRSTIATESHFVDFRTVMQKFKMINYNPMNLLRFGWTNGALTEAGNPSFRRHKLQLRYDPASSTTKEIEFQLQYSYGSKDVDDSFAKIHELEVEEREGVLPYRVVARAVNEINNNERRVRANRVNARLEDSNEYDSGRSLNVKYSAILKGESAKHHRTVSYNLFFTHGFKELREKWNVHLESESGSRDLCVDGHIEWPASSPVWNMEQIRSNPFQFKYENQIGFGRDCTESKINVVGYSKVSDRQKDVARKSGEEKEYKRTHKVLSEVTDRLRQMYSALDEADFEVKYENVPAKYMVVPRTFVQYLKSIWWSHLYPMEESNRRQPEKDGEFTTGTSKYKVRFNTVAGTFNLTINRYDNHVIRFEHVPLPYPLSYVLPLSSVRSHGGHVFIDAITVNGRDSLHPRCKVEDKWIKAFDNSSEELKIDECFHLLSGDCSSKKSFAVLIKKSSSSSSSDEESSSSSSSTKEVKVYIGKTDISLKPSEGHSRYESKIRVEVNGSEIEINGSGSRIIKDDKGRYVAEIKKSHDNVMVLKSRWIDLKFDGERLEIEASYLVKDKLCGLCGNPNKRNSYSNVNGCLSNNNNNNFRNNNNNYRSEVRSARYRVDNLPTGCPALPRNIKEALESETKNCNSVEEIPTKVRGSFETQTGKCSLHRHELIEKSDKLCFSRKPVTECGHRCRTPSTVEKKVSFACLPKSRTSERYADKVREGRVLPELENLAETFSVSMKLPRTCVPTY